MFRFLNARLISSLETQVANLRIENKRLDAVNADLSYSLNDAKADVRKRDIHIDSIQYDRLKEGQHIVRVQRELTDSRNDAAKLRQQVAEQDEEIEELEDELDAAEAANDCLLERNLQLSNAVTQLSYEVMFQPTRVTATEASLRKQLAIQKLNEGGLREQLDDRNDKIDALKAEVESLKKQRTALVKERDELKKERDELKIELTLTSLYLGDIVKGFNGAGSFIPLKAMHEGKAFYYRLIAHRPHLEPSRSQPHAKAA